MLRPKRLSVVTSRLILGSLVILLTCFNGKEGYAQTEITGISTTTSTATMTTTSVTAPSDASNDINDGEDYDIMYGEGDDVFITDYTVSGTTFDDFLYPDTLIVRRTDGGNFINIWYSLDESQGGGDGIDNGPNPNEVWLLPTQVSDAEAIYLAGIINGGYDNILVNDDDLAGSSIQAQVERVDIIWYSGISTADVTEAVYPVLERGGNDNIKVAGITSLDSNGDPSGYTSLVTIDDTDWDATFAGEDIGTQLILRRQTVGEDPIPILDNGSQEVYGVAVSFDDLGIANNEVSYGFSIFASDVTTEDLTDFATFPNTTLSSVSGLDLVAGLAAAVSSDGQLVPRKGPGGYKAALSTWLKANGVTELPGSSPTNDITTATDESSVTDWQDHWLGNHDATTLTTAPTYEDDVVEDINFNPTVDFVDAVERGLQIANNTDFNTATSYETKGINIIFRTGNDVSTKQQVYEQGSNDKGINIFIDGGDVHVGAWNESSDGTGSPWDFNSVSGTVTTDTEYIVTVEFDGNSSETGTVTAYLQGQSMGSFSSVGLLFSETDGIGLGDVNGDSRYSGADVTDAASFYGSIPEFIYCNEPGSFATAQRNRIESYLALKYGITLDQSTAYNYVDADGDIIFNTTNAASIGGYLEYNNDIAGIGRDDDSELDQRTSQSENVNSIVQMSKGSEISDDETWLIWGNDGASTAETGALTMPDTINMRVTRVWRVAEEKEMGEVSLSFDLSELGLSTASSAPYSLLIAGSGSSANFSSAEIVTGGTISSGVITFTGVSLEDGEYFTLGTQYFICTPGGVQGGLSLWLRADMETYEDLATDAAEDGDGVRSWGDQSRNDFDASEDVNRNPTWGESVINFNPALNFPNDAGSNAIGFNLGSNYIFADDADGGLHLFAAADPIDNGTTNGERRRKYIYDFGNRAGANVGFGVNPVRGTLSSPGSDVGFGGINTQEVAVVVEADFDISASDPDDRYYIINAEVERSDNITIELDNAAITENSTHASNQGPVSIGRLSETNGLNNNAGRRYFGDLAEVIAYNEELTAVEEQRVRSYLAVKYGITLSDDNDSDNTEGETLGGSVTEGDYVASDGTTIYWDYSAHEPTYVNDVTGIGRDDDTCLQQRQSRSQNTDDIVTMGLGEIAANNAANPNDFANDVNYLMWANDNGSTAFGDITTLGTPGTVIERMLRVWKVQETGTVGATDLSFDLTGLTGYSTTATDYQLIIASGGDNTSLDAGTTTPGGTFNGTVLTFSGVNFTDGQFFTLGVSRTSCGPGGVETDLQLWLRADVGTNTTVDAANVTSWNDQSLQGNNASDNFSGNTHPPAFATNGTNYNPHINFVASSDEFLTVADNTGLNPTDQTILVAGTYGSSSEDWSSLISKTQDYDWQEGWLLGKDDSGNFIYAKDDSDNGTSQASTTLVEDIPTIFIGRSEAAGNDVVNYNLEDQNSISSNTAAQTSQPVLIGAVMNGTNDDVRQHLDGSIGDIIVYDDDLTTVEQQRVGTYLAVKYGITIDQTSATNYLWSDGTTVIWNATTNSSYNNDIAGIGRDDASCFIQKQSSSVNSGEILAVGLGSVATTNLLNANSFDDDGDYLIWGNDGGATAQASANTVDVPSTVSERMTRIWKVQDTGLVGDTELEFDLASLGYGTNADDFRLIISNSATMASGSLTAGGTFNGTVLSFSGINLTDGQFFTLATALETCGPGGVNTNLSLWYRADLEVFEDAGTDAAEDADDVMQWNDQSSPAANGSEATLGGGTPVEATYQTEEINFNPVVRITDPNSTNGVYIESAAMTEPSGDFTLASVFQSGQDQGTLDNFISTPALISGAGNGSQDDYGLGFYQGAVILNADNDDAFDVTTASSNYNDNNPHIALATRTQSGGAVEIFMTGETDGTGTGDTGALGDASAIGIGNHDDGTVAGQFNGDIAESIIFSSVLTGEEQSRVETYLALKYGLTISNNRDGDGSTNELIDTQGAGTDDDIHEGDYVAADGGIIWDYADQGATYYNDIFGIGRDDLSCFEQIKSKSESADAIVTIDNTASFGDNDSWLISGNDNAAIEATRNPERPPTINSRLNREWRVQETGTVGQIELTYDLSAVTGTPLGDNNLNLVKLMVDDDGDFTTGVTLIDPSSIDGGAQTVTFLVNFTDGQYYTLGSTEVNALPITLISFDTRETSDHKVEVFWATAEEINNSFYTIERSRDGLTFEEIGFAEGAGNSNSILEYSFIDEEPLDGVSFYRLKQTDFNGEFEYSEVSRISLNLPNSAVHQVVPNPVNQGENFKITYPVTVEQDVRVAIANASGIMTYNEIVSVKPEDGEIEVTTSDLSTGLYFIRIVDQNLNTITLKFIVR